MIRVKGDAGIYLNLGTGNVVNAVEHCRAIFGNIRKLQSMSYEEIFVWAKENQVSLELVKEVR